MEVGNKRSRKTVRRLIMQTHYSHG